MKVFIQYQWPGNIRELENVMRRAIALSDWTFIYEELKNDSIGGYEEALNAYGNDMPGLDMDYEELQRLFDENNYSLKRMSKAYVSIVESRTIRETLAKTRWNRTKAAKLLGVSYKTLINRINELDIKPEMM